jgi:IMP dehydrogenase
MSEDKFQLEGLTFDDVLLIPRRSAILPRETDVTTRFTREIKLNTPLVSAAMDTVTESRMAIAMAREGGVGVLHKNMTIERQCDEVDKVKRSESGMILKPVTLPPTATIADALEIMKKFSISGIPIVDGSRKLVGILTNRDLRFAPDTSLKVTELMTKEGLVTAPMGTDLTKAEEMLQQHKIEKLPVVDDDFKLRGLITFKDIQKKKKYPSACKDEHGRLRVAAAVGAGGDAMDRAEALLDAGVDAIVIDTAHGHSEGVLRVVKAIREQFTDAQIVAGNVGTEAAARDLVELGVDAVKVGIGPGSICTTRVVTGVGMPQITAVVEAAKAASKAGVPVIADGGVKFTGDVPKAIAAGADSVMIGGLFAGVDEAPGEKALYEGRSFKMYRGMGSVEAMKEGSKDRYFQDAEDDIKKLVPEGIEGRVPYKGPLSDTVYQIVGGLRASMGYCGVATVEEMKREARFVKISGASLRESHPHDVILTKEAPNYHK